MKKITSLLISLIMLFSLFAMPAGFAYGESITDIMGSRHNIIVEFDSLPQITTVSISSLAGDNIPASFTTEGNKAKINIKNPLDIKSRYILNIQTSDGVFSKYITFYTLFERSFSDSENLNWMTESSKYQLKNGYLTKIQHHYQPTFLKASLATADWHDYTVEYNYYDLLSSAEHTSQNLYPRLETYFYLDKDGSGEIGNKPMAGVDTYKNSQYFVYNNNGSMKTTKEGIRSGAIDNIVGTSEVLVTSSLFGNDLFMDVVDTSAKSLLYSAAYTIPVTLSRTSGVFAFSAWSSISGWGDGSDSYVDNLVAYKLKYSDMEYTSDMMSGTKDVNASKLDEININWNVDLGSIIPSESNIIITDKDGVIDNYSVDHSGTTTKITFNPKLENEEEYTISFTGYDPFTPQPIKFTTAGVYASMNITCENAIKVGENTTIVAEGVLQSGISKEMGNSLLKFSSSSDAVSVSESGVIVANKAGYSVITIKLKNIDDSEVEKKFIVYSYIYKSEFIKASEENTSLATVSERESDFVLQTKVTDIENKSFYLGFDSKLAVKAGASDECYTYTVSGADVASDTKISDGDIITLAVAEEKSEIYVNGDLIYCGESDEYVNILAGGNAVTEKITFARINESAPEYTAFEISGNNGNNAEIGETLEARLEYFDKDNDNENGSVYGWYMDSSEGGEFNTLVSSSLSYKPTSENIGKYIKFIATPKNDIASGTVYQSQAYKITVSEKIQEAINEINSGDAYSIMKTLEKYEAQFEIDFSESQMIENPLYIFSELIGKDFSTPSQISEAYNIAVQKYLKTEKYGADSVYLRRSGMYVLIDYTDKTNTDQYKDVIYFNFPEIYDVEAIKDITFSVRSTNPNIPDRTAPRFVTGLAFESLTFGDSAETVEAYDQNMDIIYEKAKFVSNNKGIYTFSIYDLVKDALEDGDKLTVRLLAQDWAATNFAANGAENAEHRPKLSIVYDVSKLSGKVETSPEAFRNDVPADLSEITFSFENGVSNFESGTFELKDEKGNTIPVTPSGTKLILGSTLSEGVSYTASYSGLIDASGNPIKDGVLSFTVESEILSAYVDIDSVFIVGEEKTFNFSGKNKLGKTVLVNDDNYEVSFSDDGVFEIENGKIKALKRGSAVIKAKIKGTNVEASANAVVYNNVTTETFEDEKLSNEYNYKGMYSKKVNSSNELLVSGEGEYVSGYFYNDKNAAEFTLEISGSKAINENISLSSLEKGWHNFTVSKGKLYIDGIEKATVQAGEYTSVSASALSGAVWFDNVSLVDVDGTVCEASAVMARGDNVSLSGEYKYSDADNDKESGSIYEWLYSGSEAGPYTVITGANELNFSPSAYSGYYIKFAVTPANIYEKGEKAESLPVYIQPSTVQGGAGSSGGSFGGSSGGVSIPVTSGSTGGSVESENKSLFNDVSVKHWAYGAIKAMKEKGVINGFGNGDFKPEDAVTRAQFICAVAKLLNETGKVYQNGFNDVSSSDWYAPFVQVAFEKGYISGYNGAFNPNSNITRQEMAVVIDRIVGGSETKELTFTDKDEISTWAYESVSRVYAGGFMTGTDTGAFEPENPTTRAQMAVILERLANR